ncbi:response regulator [Aquabacterium sp. A7-Y]|uniref:response regulator n=1 Tax=Aquabacterium sp. A7-Y TaxID=1349605 RepID=UPI00223E4027|nr:response regulator [Aquabacterium sp. A7-Y]MCW7540106.1 response regulator [Aquabacterium sp. A7-Y]
MEFSELFTQSAREVLPLARAKGLVSYFDYRGPYIRLLSADATLRGGIHRVLLGMTDCIAEGFVMFSAEVSAPRSGTSQVAVYAAGTGVAAPSHTVAEVLQRLGLMPDDSGAGARTIPTRASGVCPVTFGKVVFLDEGREGSVISLTTQLAAAEVPGAEPLPDAAGVAAWLVSPVPGGLDSVGRRLRLSGWRVRSFGTLEQVTALLNAGSASVSPPLLLMVAESTGTELAQLESIAASVPALWTVLAVLAGSPTLQARGATPVDIRPLPLSPQELERFTTHVDWRTSTAESRETSPSPLYLEDGGLILVVDDNTVNQLVARGQLEALGYEVAVAADGAEALAYCCRQAPDMVLMDVDMPVMDGLEATERLRAWQQVGTLPPFPIVAATSAHSQVRRDDCLASGMDGYLSKPMSLRDLADEIHRVLPAHQAARGNQA